MPTPSVAPERLMALADPEAGAFTVRLPPLVDSVAFATEIAPPAALRARLPLPVAVTEAFTLMLFAALKVSP